MKSFYLRTPEVRKHICVLQLQRKETEHFYACKTFSIHFSFVKKIHQTTLITSETL